MGLHFHGANSPPNPHQHQSHHHSSFLYFLYSMSAFRWKIGRRPLFCVPLTQAPEWYSFTNLARKATFKQIITFSRFNWLRRFRGQNLHRTRVSRLGNLLCGKVPEFLTLEKFNNPGFSRLSGISPSGVNVAHDPNLNLTDWTGCLIRGKSIHFLCGTERLRLYRAPAPAWLATRSSTGQIDYARSGRPSEQHAHTQCSRKIT